MAGTLRFSVEVAADQATQALQAISVAANQAGVQMRSALLGVKPAADAANKSIESFGNQVKAFAREQRAEARTVGFFVQEISQIVPMTGAAQAGVAALGQTLVGGAGLTSAIFAGIGALGAISMALRNFYAESKKAADELQKTWDAAQVAAGKAEAAVAKNLGGDAAALRVETARKTAELTKKYTEEVKNLSTAEQELADLRERQGTSELVTPAERKLIDNIGAIQNRIDALKSAARELLATSEISQRAIDKAATATKKTDEKPFFGPGYGADLGAFWKTAADETKRYEDAIANAAAVGNERFLRFLRSSKELTEQNAAAWGTIEEAAVSAFGAIGAAIGGQTGAVLAATVELIVRAIQMAVAYAAASAAETPLIGWSIALPAAAALLGALTGLIGSVTVPSAAGGWWDTGSYRGLAMLHEREMVLPSDIADGLREGRPAATGNVVVNALDGASVRRVLRSRRGELARALRELSDDRRRG